MAAHRSLWNELWESDILIEGDDEAQRAVRFALFNLYSSCREGSGLSISPMGLSSQGYNGHIFWDSELWMFPPMLLLNKGIAESMIDYRIDRLMAARKKAMAYGFKGAMFPWESDDYGEESTPTFALTGPLEHHITADISIACWNYYCLTRDGQWLRTKAFPLMKAVADFWVSRVTRNDDGSYSICNVVGADEYANGVDDNAFTNGAAIRALEYACEAARICNEPVPEIWKEVGKGIRILRFKDGVTREHATYNGEMIKQADVNLLGYPLYFVGDVMASPEFNNVYKGYMYLNQKGFKFSSEDSWNGTNYGADFSTAADAANIMMTEEAGFYQIVVDLNEKTYTLTPIAIGIIGPATPSGWDADTDMELVEYTEEGKGTIHYWTITTELKADELKFRANDDWDISWGGTSENLTTNNGANLKIATAGTYTINLYPLCEGKAYCTIEAAN